LNGKDNILNGKDKIGNIEEGESQEQIKPDKKSRGRKPTKEKDDDSQ